MQHPLVFTEFQLDLNGQGDWDQASLQAVLDSAQTQRIHMKPTLPVLIVYLTANLDTDDRIRFLPDVCDRDGKLLEALDGEVRIALPEA